MSAGLSFAPGPASILVGARSTTAVDGLCEALAGRGYLTRVADPRDLFDDTDDTGGRLPTGLRVVVWVAPAPRPAGPDDLLGTDDWDAAAEEHLDDAFLVLRAAAEGMHRLDPVQGERGVVVLVAARDRNLTAAHGALLHAVAALTFTAARDLADLRIRVVGLVRDADNDDGIRALLLHALDNPMLNGLTIGARGRIPGGW